MAQVSEFLSILITLDSKLACQIWHDHLWLHWFHAHDISNKSACALPQAKFSIVITKVIPKACLSEQIDLTRMVCLSLNTSLLMNMVALVCSTSWFWNRVASDLGLMCVVDPSWWHTTGVQISTVPSRYTTSLHSFGLLAFQRREWKTLGHASW